MDDTLQRLLDTELRAEKIAKHAETELERVIKDTIASTHAEIKKFEASVPAIYASFVEKAEVRAEQAVTEMKRRYDDRHVQLRELAEQREDEAMEAAFTFLIDSASDQVRVGGQ
jgi:hypothetical protein